MRKGGILESGPTEKSTGKIDIKKYEQGISPEYAGQNNQEQKRMRQDGPPMQNLRRCLLCPAAWIFCSGMDFEGIISDVVKRLDEALFA